MTSRRAFYWICTCSAHNVIRMTTTVRDATFRLLERHGMKTVFGNPGSNELPFLAGLPDGFRYVLGLHEGVVLGMADGYAQASGRPAFVSLHAASGTGNAMGALTNAAISRTPLVISAGQQVRSTVGMDAMLANGDATLLTRPLTVSSIEPLTPLDVPRAFSQAIHDAVTARRGPSYLSVPYDDWDQPAGTCTELLLARTVTSAGHLGADTVDRLAADLRGARRPAFVLGSDLDGPVPMDSLVALAEHLDAAVWAAPSLYRLPFPNRHRLFRGVLPAGIASISTALRGHDLVVVLGAPVFRYHQHEPGPYLAEGTRLVQITDDPAAAARAPFGEALIAELAAAVRDLASALGAPTTPAAEGARDRYVPSPPPQPGTNGRLSPDEVFAALRDTQPQDTAYVVESTSTKAAFREQMDLRHPGSYYFPASGGLGFGLPAAVGVALAHPERRVVAVVGDGSANYGITALWTAAQLRLPLTFVILRNGTYGALRWFADLLNTPDVPGLDVPGIDFVSIAAGYGVPATHVADLTALRKALSCAPDGPRLLEVDTTVTTTH